MRLYRVPHYVDCVLVWSDVHPDDLARDQYDLECQCCHRPFRYVVTHHRRRYAVCSDRCRAEMQARERLAQRQERLDRGCTCAWCQQPFRPKRKDAKTCSALCRKKLERYRKADAEYQQRFEEAQKRADSELEYFGA